MAIPLVPVIAALAAGGSLVPHAAGGMIVSGSTGYVAGTYLSTAAIGGLLATTTSTLGAGALYLSGAASKLVSATAGILGTKAATTGAVAAVATPATTIASIPFLAPIAIGATLVGGSFVAYRVIKLRRKVSQAGLGEAQFSEAEAKMIERIIKRPPFAH